MVVVLCRFKRNKTYRNGSFRKDGVPYLGGPYKKDPTIWGTVLGSPYFRKAPCGILI